MKHLFLSCVVVAGLTACSNSSEKSDEAEPVAVQEAAAVAEAGQKTEKQAKYGFSYLTSVKVVSDFPLTSFQAIDGKSLIVRSGDRSYLLVLNKINLSLKMTHHIFIGSNKRLASSSISSGSDKVAVNAGFSNAASISSIYEISTTAEEEKIKRQVLGENFSSKLSKEHNIRNMKEASE